MPSDAPPPARPVIVLDHVTVTVADIEPARAVYDALLGALGLVSVVEYLDPEDADEVGAEAIGFAADDGRVLVWLVTGSPVTGGSHVALRVHDTGAVEAFATAGRTLGLPVIVSPRRGAPLGAPMVSATVTDPAGNAVEAVVWAGDGASRQSTSV